MRLTIHRKLIIVFGFIFAAIFFSVYSHLNYTLTSQAYKRIKANIYKETRFAKFFIENYSSQNSETKDIDAIADKIGEILALRVTVIGVDGVVLGDSRIAYEKLSDMENHLYRAEVQAALKFRKGESRRFSTTLKQDMLYVAVSYGKESLEGIIRLAIPLSDIEIISNHLRNTLFIVLGLAFLFALGISFLASIFISKPIKTVSEAARNLAKGNIVGDIDVRTDDEVGDLAASFNYMAEQVRNRLREVMISRSRLEAVLLSMVEGVMVVDSKGEVILVNRALKKLLVVAREITGKKPIEVIRNSEIQEMADYARKNIDGVKISEIKFLVPEEKILLVRAAAIRLEDSGISGTNGAVLVFHEITHLRQLEKMRKEFVANVSHELRTPIACIKGYAETLLNGALEDRDNAKDFLDIICSESERLAGLIDDLLDFAKIEDSNLKIVLNPCAIVPVMKKVLSNFRRLADEKNIELKLSVEGDIPEVLADETRLTQVVSNLIDNAIKYTREGGKVLVAVFSTEGFVRVDVSDTGIGIPANDLERLFERFYRVDRARSRELGGTGLGLAIVKHIIDAHNGKVFVKSELSKGSIFTFILPIV